MCVLIMSTTIIFNISHSKKSSVKYGHKRTSCKVPVILVRVY